MTGTDDGAGLEAGFAMTETVIGTAIETGTETETGAEIPEIVNGTERETIGTDGIVGATEALRCVATDASEAEVDAERPEVKNLRESMYFCIMMSNTLANVISTFSHFLSHRANCPTEVEW